jgi:pimeloyl-ACP methyl ester carboxylesterase
MIEQAHMIEQMGTFGPIPLAWRRVRGGGPGVLFLGGLRSDMTGAKAAYLAAWCAARGHAFLRFDHRGHGTSGGRFEEGTIGLWLEDALGVLDALTEGPQVVVGSSMGGWLALLLALRRPERVRALVGIAAAPDFTEELIWARLSPELRSAIAREGQWLRPSPYGEPYPITRALIEDGRRHLLLGGPIAIEAPVRLLHGMGDEDVPWEVSSRLAERLTGSDVRVTLVKSGDHRLSSPAELALLGSTLARLLGEDRA